jgi:hypothetical protein
MRYVTRPLSDEARLRLKGVRQEYSRFDSTWTATLGLLDRELGMLGVRHEFVLQIDVQESDLKLDGELRANARPMSSAVAISLKAKGSDLLFVCGKFPRWQENVRAIALGLEALRKVERYGIVQSNEQYRGWQALPPGTPMPAAKMTVEEAESVLREHMYGNEHSAPPWAELYRRGAKVHHPDAGGDPDDFLRLAEARDVLGAFG